jgi:hypothetical protein
MVSKRTSPIAKPKVAKPFNQGYRGFLVGNLTNPYPQNTKDHRDWEFGFNKAYFKNKEQVLDKESRRRS